jgi:hypothetical protein
MKLNKRDHRRLVLWAAECAEHALSCFETVYPDDRRPRSAVEAARAWARLKIELSEARAEAFAAHAAARDADHFAARAAARAAAHAADAGHVADHARHAATYAVTAMRFAVDAKYAEMAEAREREWQRERLPERMRTVVITPNVSEEALKRGPGENQ